MNKSSANLKKLSEAAQLGQKQAYSPYSEYKIGAALQFSDGKIYSGCNIENASYGATVCAERVALWKAISERGWNKKQKIDTVYVLSSAQEAWPPCGLCLQVLSEFAHEKTKILIQGQKGQSKTFLFKDLFPKAFYPSYLKGSKG